MDVLIRIKGGIPEVVAKGQGDLHVLFLDEDLDGSQGEDGVVEFEAAGQKLKGVLYCQQTDELRYTSDESTNVLGMALLVHELHEEFGDAWEDYLCRVCKVARNDGGDGYDGCCPSCADDLEEQGRLGGDDGGS